MENKKTTKGLTYAAFAAVFVFWIIAANMTTPETVQVSFWALVPPIVAIGLALITKEVYSSLFIGIVTGALLFSGFNFEGTITHIFNDTCMVREDEVTSGIIAMLSDSYNVGILVFLVILGIIVQLMNRTGGSAAFGNWASNRIKTRVGAQLATIGLGILIFIDDYFNCLTVGSVMRPVTDKHKISRAKLAYLIDATAAPVCIIAPISSWAAAVSGFVEGQNGISLFVRAIPFNYYALLTIVMMVLLVVFKVDFGPMAHHEANALKGDLFSSPSGASTSEEDAAVPADGKVIDMLMPIISLIVCCVVGMIYTGGFFSGTSFAESFANSDASVGLAYGSMCALIVTIIFYMFRRVLSFDEIMECVPEGFKQMVSPILILTFAWTLKSQTDSLGAKIFVAEFIKGQASGLVTFLPFIIFLIAVFLSFATGTSWGTFGILIPIVVNCFSETDPQLMIIAISACMAGSVCGDHCSPISDTTIMSSAGAQCEHLNHVSTQMPYALICAAISAVTYIISAFVEKATGNLTIAAVVSLPCGIAMVAAVLLLIKFVKKEPAAA